MSSSELHLKSINHTLASYDPSAYASLPSFEIAVLQLAQRGWRRFGRALQDVGLVFAKHNKWDEYGIALSFKDLALQDTERLIDFNGALVPYDGTLEANLERRLIPRSIRIWEGKMEATSFTMQQEQSDTTFDIEFEREALLRLGGLSLVRLQDTARTMRRARFEVEGVQNGLAVTLPLAVSEQMLMEEDLIPTMWEYRRFREVTGDTHKIVATRFRRPPVFERASTSSSELSALLGMYEEPRIV